MKDYVAIMELTDSIQICFYNEHAKIIEIGEKMNTINEEAYMNGYNWEAFFDYYLKKYEPSILQDMDTDSEAGMYVAFYPLTSENKKRAEKFVKLISSLIEQEEELYRIVEKYGNEIEWD